MVDWHKDFSDPKDFVLSPETFVPSFDIIVIVRRIRQPVVPSLQEVRHCRCKYRHQLFRLRNVNDPFDYNQRSSSLPLVCPQRSFQFQKRKYILDHDLSTTCHTSLLSCTFSINLGLLCPPLLTVIIFFTKFGLPKSKFQ